MAKLKKKDEYVNSERLMKPRREDVAKLAGVSAGSISYYTNGTRKVSPKTEEKIKNAIKELNYVPDMAAVGLVKKESKMLTIVANDLSYPLYNQIVIEFEKEAMKRGYFTNICGGTFEFSEYLKSIIARKIDGIYILIHPKKITYDDFKLLHDNDIKIASGTGAFDDIDYIARINCNYEKGLKIAVDYLYGKGHRNIVYLTGTPEDYKDDRVTSYITHMLALGLKPSVVYGTDLIDMDESKGEELAEIMLNKYAGATAVICMSDGLARGVLIKLHKKGIMIPDDLSLISIDDTEISRFSIPALTSIGYSRNEFAGKAVDSLVSMINGGECSKKEVEMYLVERESVKNLNNK